MIVYADVLIFINGVITYFLLLGVCAFFKFRPKTYRLIFGAFAGGISALIIFLPPLMFVVQVLLRATVCAGIVLITFSYKNRIRFIKFSLAFLTVTYIFGGAMLAICEILKPQSLYFANGVAYFDISPLVLILSSGAIYLFIRFLMLFKKNSTEEQLVYECFVEFSGVKVKFLGVNDTANSLKDPYFCSAAVIVEESVLKPILECEPKTYLIPVKSIATKGLICAFRPDAFFIVHDKKTVRIKDVTVCIAKTPLHKEYNGILSPEIISIGEDELCLRV